MNTSRTLMKKQNSDEAALKKYTMILPLLDENLDPASAHELRISIAEKNDISERTVRRLSLVTVFTYFKRLRLKRFESFVGFVRKPQVHFRNCIYTA